MILKTQILIQDFNCDSSVSFKASSSLIVFQISSQKTLLISIFSRMCGIIFPISLIVLFTVITDKERGV
ncbi:hypothetical protein QVD17_20497 [Tagetes erecta]|uniref:Uncharacterized protein n=1 Tax=Tagetes erecta TaxID=13708 RepID=A0AAD8KLL5_TARER|nr:hypothetical protein QVD17_20497 [Tagetes erecta]